MTKFNHKTGSTAAISRKRTAIILIVALLALMFGSAVLVRQAYESNLKPLSSSKQGIIVTIQPGTPPSKIAEQLKQKGVIKSDWALEWYVRNHNLRDQLKAGTYLFSPSQSIPEIVEQLAAGKVATDLVTILPGKRLDQVKADFVKSGFAQSEVDAAFDPKLYEGHPALTDKPKDASLEGYLYPESFQKDANTTVKRLVKLSLDEMHQHLTPEIRENLNKQGLTVHQGIIMASMVEKEVSNEIDRATAAQVFLKRYRQEMNLGSDVTAFYGAIIAGQEPAISYDSPYNTRIHPGLPAGPISNVTDSSLKAVAYPAQTDWLYFVSGDDGKTYFSKTLEEHQALTAKYCKKLCNQ